MFQVSDELRELAYALVEPERRFAVQQLARGPRGLFGLCHRGQCSVLLGPWQCCQRHGQRLFLSFF